MSKITIKTKVEGIEIMEEIIKNSMLDIIKYTKAKNKAEESIDQAKVNLSVAFKVVGITDPIKTTTQGTFSPVAPSKSNSFDKGTCKTNLAEAGVDLTVITKAFEAATSSNPKAGYIKWDKPKKKKKEDE